jgi:phage terminase large subunit-like protein
MEALDLQRIAVGVDPSGGGDAQGVGAAGLGTNGHLYVLQDATCNLSPLGWGRRVVEVHDRWDADCAVAERNFGGDMVDSNIRTAGFQGRLQMVTASRGKHIRFEPLGGMYEQGRVHHVGTFPELEDEVCAFTPTGYEGDGSPNRADWLVWAAYELVFDAGEAPSPDDFGWAG